MMQQQMMQPHQQMVQSAGHTTGFGKRPEAWHYPFTGMGHFLTHPALWIYAICPIICGVIATIFAIGFVTYRTDVQYDWLMSLGVLHDHPFWSGVVLFFLSLAEIAVIAFTIIKISLAVLFRNVFIETMKAKGVWQGENLECNLMDELWWAVVGTVFAVVLMPLHLIPVLGTVIYCAANGALYAWEFHEGYFVMCGIPYKEQRHEVFKYWQDYAVFGLICQLLLFVPFVGPFTFVTSVCGAACWAADLEVRGCRPEGTKVALATPAGVQLQQQIAPMRGGPGEMQGMHKSFPSNP